MLSEQRKAQLRETVQAVFAYLDSKYPRVQAERLICLDPGTKSVDVRFQLQRHLNTTGRYQTVSLISPQYAGEMTGEEEEFIDSVEEEMGWKTAIDSLGNPGYWPMAFNWAVLDPNDPEYNRGDVAIMMSPDLQEAPKEQK